MIKKIPVEMSIWIKFSNRGYLIFLIAIVHSNNVYKKSNLIRRWSAYNFDYSVLLDSYTKDNMI